MLSMLMCIQNLVRFFQFVLKILSGKSVHGMTEPRIHGITEGQGESSIAPLFQSGAIMITYRSAKIGFCPATKCSLPDSCHAANKKISRRLAICINLNLNPRLLYLESNTTFYHFATMLPEIQKTFILKANDF